MYTYAIKQRGWLAVYVWLKHTVYTAVIIRYVCMSALEIIKHSTGDGKPTY